MAQHTTLKNPPAELLLAEFQRLERDLHAAAYDAMTRKGRREGSAGHMLRGRIAGTVVFGTRATVRRMFAP